MNIIQYLRQTTGEPGILKYALSDKQALEFLKTKIANAVEDFEIPILNTIDNSDRFMEVCQDIGNYVCEEVKDVADRKKQD